MSALIELPDRSENTGEPVKLLWLIGGRLSYVTLNKFHPLYFSCTDDSVCKNAHKSTSSKSNDDELKTMGFLIAERNWASLLNRLFIFTTAESSISEEIFRSLLYAITESSDYHKRFVDVLKMHLKLHPPCDKNLKGYYRKIVCDDFEKDKSGTLMFNLAFTLEALLNAVLDLDAKPAVKANSLSSPSSTVKSLLRNFADRLYKPLENSNKLSLPQKLERLFSVFDILLDIMDQDLYMIVFRRFKTNTEEDPIIATAASQSKTSFNQHCSNINELLVLTPQEFRHHVYRYISMLAEVVRISDEKEKEMRLVMDRHEKYVLPFCGILCKRFAQELSKAIYGLQDDDAMISVLEGVEPLWLKMLVSFHLFDRSMYTKPNIELSRILTAIKKKITLHSKHKTVNRKNSEREQKVSHGEQAEEKDELDDNPPGASTDLAVVIPDTTLRLMFFLVTSYIKVYHVKSSFNIKDYKCNKLEPNFEIISAQLEKDNAVFNDLFELVTQLHCTSPNSSLRVLHLFLKNRLNSSYKS